MIRRNRFLSYFSCAVPALVLACALPIAAQTHPQPTQPAPATAPPANDQEAAQTQEQLLHLLRMSPVLTSVVARDPSLLADQAYVTRNNPELEQFLVAHPDVARNPEFYLFSHLNGNGHRDQALERAVWPDFASNERPQSSVAAFMHDLVPIIIVPALFLAIVWIVRLFVDSRRWSRTFKQQSDVHARLIDKFSTSQDLAAYMETESGKSFLAAAPIAFGTDSAHPVPNAVARVLTPLQVGIVMTLLGIGFLLLRNAGPDLDTPMLVLGSLTLMPGIGFILSAGATWVLARRLGLLPEKPSLQNEPAAPFGSQDRQ